MPWLEGDARLHVMRFHKQDRQPFLGDPCHAFDRVLHRCEAKGLSPVTAAELEFYLFQPNGETVLDPATGEPLPFESVLCLRMLDRFDGFFSAVYAGAEAMGIGLEAATSEGGAGQFELTLLPQPPQKTADDIVLLKELI